MTSAVRALFVVAALAACKPTSTVAPTENEEEPDETLPEQGAIEEAATLMSRGYPDKALAVIEDALAKTPDEHELLYARGVALQGLGRGEEAVASWKECLQRSPEYFPALNGIGAVELDAGNLDGAIEALRGAIEAKPDFPDAHYNLGLALKAKGEFDGALAAFEQAKELAPGDADVHLMLAMVSLRRDDLAQARASVDVALDLRKDDPEVARVDAKVLTAEGRHAEAATVYGGVVAAIPEDAESRLQLARALVRADQAAQALPHLERLAKDLPDEAVVWSEWGGALLKLGSNDGPEGSLARIDHALELGPDLVSAKVRRIEALAALGRCKEATADHREVIKAAVKATPQADEALRACGGRRGK